MRACRFLFCDAAKAAAAATAAEAAKAAEPAKADEPTAEAPKPEAEATPEVPEVPQVDPLFSKWRTVALPEWRVASMKRAAAVAPRRASEWATAVTTGNAAQRVSFLGPTLGPHPVVVMPGFSPAGSTAELDPFVPFLSALQYRHGALCVHNAEASIADAAAAVQRRRDERFDAFAKATAAPGAIPPPMVPAVTDGAAFALDGFLADYCASVAAALEAYRCEFAACIVGHGVGALAAVKMAALYPEAVGSLVLVDTPVVTAQQVEREAARRELWEARHDVNVPEDMLDFAAMQLEEADEAPACPLPAQQPLYDAIFSHEATVVPFGQDGATRDAGAFLAPSQVRTVRHPAMLVTPAKGAPMVADVAAARDSLLLRKHQPIKAAKAHGDLLSEPCAAEVAAAVKSWLDRFDADVTIRRKWQQAKVEAERPFQAKDDKPKAAAAEAEGKGEGKGKKKKNKKKKEKE